MGDEDSDSSCIRHRKTWNWWFHVLRQRSIHQLGLATERLADGIRARRFFLLNNNHPAVKWHSFFLHKQLAGGWNQLKNCIFYAAHDVYKPNSCSVDCQRHLFVWYFSTLAYNSLVFEKGCIRLPNMEGAKCQKFYNAAVLLRVRIPQTEFSIVTGVLRLSID